MKTENNYTGARYGLVPYDKIVDGRWYWMKTGKRRRMAPLAIHNNFLPDAAAKMARFKNFHQWTLASDQNCNLTKVHSLLARGC
ncbi:hypothetical protein ACOMHN_051504 [Nucella lapillus]